MYKIGRCPSCRRFCEDCEASPRNPHVPQLYILEGTLGNAQGMFHEGRREMYKKSQDVKVYNKKYFSGIIKKKTNVM